MDPRELGEAAATSRGGAWLDGWSGGAVSRLHQPPLISRPLVGRVYVSHVSIHRISSPT